MDRDLLGHLPDQYLCCSQPVFPWPRLEHGMSPSAISHAVRSVEGPTGHSIMCGTNRNRKA
jgi:hypothetical protein